MSEEKKSWRILPLLLGRLGGSAAKNMTAAEQRLGGMLRLTAVILSMVVGGITLYSKFKEEPQALVPHALILYGDKAKVLQTIKNSGGTFKVQPNAFPPENFIRAGTKAYGLGWFTKFREDCILTKVVMQLYSDFGLSVPLASIDVSNIRVPNGRQMAALPAEIPLDTPPGNYMFYTATAYQCGNVTQLQEFPRFPVTITAPAE